jgi:hypothetical protein
MDYKIANKREVEVFEERRMCRACRVVIPHMCGGPVCGPWQGVTGSSQTITEVIDEETVTFSSPIAGVFCKTGTTYPTAPLDPNGQPWP